MENNEINRTTFYALYLFQQVLKVEITDDILVLNTTTLNDYHEGDHLLLTSLLDITDKDLIHVARLAHERPDADFTVTKNSDIYYARTSPDRVGIYYFISMLPKYATVCATMNFAKTERHAFKSSTINIGKINLSAARPVPYIAIVDYLRSKGYALPYMGLSVEKQIEYKWIELC